MADFVFNDVIKSKSGEYFLKTANSMHQSRIISSFFRNGTLINSQFQSYDDGISDERLLEATRSFHEEKKAEVQSLLELSEKLRESDQGEMKNLLGLAFLRKGMYDEAIAEFEDAIVLNPKNSIVYNNLGKAYLGVKKYDEAIGVLEEAISLSPRFADFHNNLGLAYLHKSQCKKAVERFKKATEQNPYYADAYFNLGLAYVMNAHTREDFELSVDCYAKVMENMEKAAKINPNYKTDLFDRASELLRNEEYLKAYEAFTQVKDAAGTAMDLSFILDFYLRVINNGKRVKSATIWRHIRHLEELVKKYPNYADLYNHLGVAYVIMSKYVNNKAIQLFNKAMEINPNFERAKKNKRLAEYDHKGMQLLFEAILK